MKVWIDVYLASSVYAWSIVLPDVFRKSREWLQPFMSAGADNRFYSILQIRRRYKRRRLHQVGALVNRRLFTYNRFLDHYEELSVESVLDFYKANDFLRPHSYCLLHQDMLAWIRFMENQQLVGRELYIGLDRVEEEWMM